MRPDGAKGWASRPTTHDSAVRSVARARNGGGSDGVADAETVYCRETRTRRRRHDIRYACSYTFMQRRFVLFFPRFERKPENLHDEINLNATHTNTPTQSKSVPGTAVVLRGKSRQSTTQ